MVMNSEQRKIKITIFHDSCFKILKKKLTQSYLNDRFVAFSGLSTSGALSKFQN